MDFLAIPEFLDRRKFDEQGKLIRSPIPDFVVTGDTNVPRIWAPIRSVTEARRRERKPLFCDNDSFEVQVNISQNGKALGIAVYENFKEFLDEHDFEAHPVKRMATVGEQTIVLVGGFINIPRDPNAPMTLMSRAPRASGTRDLIWSRADALWSAAGSPSDIPTILKLRKEWMNILEKEGLNRATCSSELGNWQKSKIIKK